MAGANAQSKPLADVEARPKAMVPNPDAAKYAITLLLGEPLRPG
jgi:hypothetical protein